MAKKKHVTQEDTNIWLSEAKILLKTCTTIGLINIKDYVHALQIVARNFRGTVKGFVHPTVKVKLRNSKKKFLQHKFYCNDILLYIGRMSSTCTPNYVMMPTETFSLAYHTGN